MCFLFHCSFFQGQEFIGRKNYNILLKSMVRHINRKCKLYTILSNLTERTKNKQTCTHTHPHTQCSNIIYLKTVISTKYRFGTLPNGVIA